MTQNKDILDLIIIGAWPSGLFACLQLQKHSKLSLNNILLLEKQSLPAQKLLLSAKWRWNVTNLHADETHYFPQNHPFVNEVFSRYWVSDFCHFLEESHLSFHEEDFWRIILDQWVKSFHQFLLDGIHNYNIPFHTEEFPLEISKSDGIFSVKTNRAHYFSKNILIATWSRSVPSLWSTDFATQIAQQFHLHYEPFYPALVWFETEKDLSSLSWSSLIATCEIWDHHRKIFQQTGPILFTHWGISGPVIFNASLRIKNPDHQDSLECTLMIEKQHITKRFLQYLHFRNNKLPKYFFHTNIVKKRSFDEAKVCWWWILLEELTPFFECKHIPGLFFIWESAHLTWETWWFNLQWCRSSAFCFSEKFC